MIDPKELRIGNWVTGNYAIPNPIPIEVYSIQNDYGINELGEDSFEPIPLTPEILEKCEFEINFSLGRNQALKFIYSRRVLVSFYKNGRTDITIDGDKSVSTFSKKFNGKKLYLHQLQNLYFALTGEELKINFNVEAHQ